MTTDYDSLADGFLLALIEAQERLGDDERLGHLEPTAKMIEQAVANLRARLAREERDALLVLSHAVAAASEMGEDDRLSFYSPTAAEVAHAKAALYRKLFADLDDDGNSVGVAPGRKEPEGRSLTLVSALSAASSGLRRAASFRDSTRSALAVLAPAAPRVRVIEAAPLPGPPELGAVEDWQVSVHDARREPSQRTDVASTTGTHGDAGDLVGWRREPATRADAGLPRGWTAIVDDRVPLELPAGAAPSVKSERFYGFRRGVKTVFDYVASASGLVVLSPLLAGIAVVIRATSDGPALFIQPRVGRNGKVFRLIKFRTMYLDADSRLAELVGDDDLSNGGLLKRESDPRVTRVGRVLRKHSLDEFPQLINVLTGSMSIVGPRPPLPNEVSRYSTALRRRLLVKPGVTGLWQVSGRSDLTWDEKVDLDLHYVDEWSLRLDLHIAWKTIGALLRGKGAY